MNDDTTHLDVRPMAAPPGGVMTREVGAVTGDLEVWLDPSRPGVVRVRYAGALDEYTVVGRASGASIDDVVATLTRDPGTDADGNPASTDLTHPPAPAATAPSEPTAERSAPEQPEPPEPEQSAPPSEQPKPEGPASADGEPAAEAVPAEHTGGTRRAHRGGHTGRRSHLG